MREDHKWLRYLSDKIVWQKGNSYWFYFTMQKKKKAQEKSYFDYNIISY